LLSWAERYIVKEELVALVAASGIVRRGKESDQSGKKRWQIIPREVMIGRESAVTPYANE
jgi:hypothetical protein